MADEGRTTPNVLGLLRALSERPYDYGFFPAARQLECLFRERPRLGESLHPRDDPVRLGQDPHMGFAPSTLSSCQLGSNAGAPRVAGYFLGVFGPNGPLPLHLTEYAYQRAHNESDPTFARFADIFHHRMLSLFYRAWAKSQPTVNFDRPESDRFALYLGSLFGLGMESARDRDLMPDRAKMHFAGFLSCQTRHPDGLKAIIEAFFAMPVQIVEFVGDWMVLPADSRWRLGASRESGVLGVSATVGARVWGYHQKFRIVLGPMGYRDYSRLLPGSDSLARLAAVVRNYIGDELDWDVNLVLKGEEVPELQLGRAGRLGWTTWLNPRRSDADADDLKLRPSADLHRATGAPEPAPEREAADSRALEVAS